MSRNSKHAPKPLWLIVKDEPGRIDVLTTDLAAGEEALPVFSFEDEARMFLELGVLGSDWRVRETAAGELVSVLCGPCTNVGRVVLDPLPLSGWLPEDFNILLSMDRKSFMGSLLNVWRIGFSGTRGSGVCRRAGVTVRAETPVRS